MVITDCVITWQVPKSLACDLSCGLAGWGTPWPGGDYSQAFSCGHDRLPQHPKRLEKAAIGHPRGKCRAATLLIQTDPLCPPSRASWPPPLYPSKAVTVGGTIHPHTTPTSSDNQGWPAVWQTSNLPLLATEQQLYLSQHRGSTQSGVQSWVRLKMFFLITACLLKSNLSMVTKVQSDFGCVCVCEFSLPIYSTQVDLGNNSNIWVE